jgi:hypothetical protein
MNLLEQASRAERLARSITDERTVEAFTRYARECREKAAAPADLSTRATHPKPVFDYVLAEGHGRTNQQSRDPAAH